MLSLSEQGYETAKANHKLWHAHEEHLLDALNEEEKENLRIICAKLLESWEADHA